MSVRYTFSRICLLLSIILMSTAAFSAPAGSIKGTIKDAQTKDPLPFANLTIKGTSLGTASDISGIFTIQAVPAGVYKLRVGFIGYRTKEVNVTVTEDKATQLNIVMDPVSIEGDVVVVTAQAQGQNQAINEQLTSTTIKNVVSSAKIQELPDVNAAESVSRLPGVSLIRTGGEGSKVVVRGLSPQYNRITIDGVELPGNSTSSDPNEHKTQFSDKDEVSLTGDRGSDLSMISSNMLGGIEVIKAITPDMDATVFGGVVNFSMRKAQKISFEAPKFEVLGQGNHNSLKNTTNDYKFVASYEQRFFENSFGVFAQGTIEKKNLSDNEMSANYAYGGSIDVTSVDPPEFNSLNLGDVFRDRKRYGGTLVFDYVYETGSIGFMNFFSRSDTRTINRNEDIQLEANDLFYTATNSNNTLDVFSNLLSVKQELGGFNVDLKLSHSFSGSKSPDDVNFRFWQDDAGFTNLLSSLKYAASDVVDSKVIHTPDKAVFFNISNIDVKSKDRTYNAALDITKDVTLSDYFSTKIKFGGAFNYRDRSYDYNQASGSVFYDDGGQVAGAISRAFPQLNSTGNGITFADFTDPSYSYGDFLKGKYTLGPPMNVDLMLKVIEVAKGHPGAGNGGGYKPQVLASRLYDYRGDEKRSAGYAMMSLNYGEALSLIPGVRYQTLTTSYTGLRAKVIGAGLDSAEATATKTHGYLLPMVHLQYKPFEWLQFHFAYTNTLNYADYNTIIPMYLIGTNYILYNNTDLKPARSENFDGVVSVYSNEVGLFTIGGFKKRIVDLIFPVKSYPKDYSAYPELYAQVKGATEVRSLNTYINNPIKIDVYGIETEWQTNFWYLPGALTGLVLNINYTHIFSEANYPKTFIGSYLDSNFIQQTYSIDTSYSTRLLNQPNDVINISLGYDYAGFSVRASMLYKDNVFKRPDFWAQNRVNSEKYVRYDLSAKQDLPWYGIQLFLNLNNITGEDDIDLNQSTSFITSMQRYGMTADLGLRIRL
ncbi:MAG TPA: TonB-dependent receptor [Bacteroidota bacterium]|nr:TonB-dependent receptor [Bacteroidota bacterium]